MNRLQAAGMGLGRDLWVTQDGVLFAEGDLDSTNIYRLPFDYDKGAATGAPVPIINGAGFNFGPKASQDGRRIAFAVGTNLTTNIWRAPIDAATGRAGEPVRITSGLDFSRAPSPSRDGKLVAYVGGTSKVAEVRLREVATGKETRLAKARDWSYVVLSPDGSTIAFHADARDHPSIYTVPAAGGMPRKVCDGCGRPIEWSPDGSKLLVDSRNKGVEIDLLDVATGVAKPIVKSAEYGLRMPRLSPDGRLLAFSEMRPGRVRRIYVVPFTGELVGQEQWSVVADGPNLDRQPVWAPSGNLIYFLSDRDGSRCVWAQRVDPGTRKPAEEPFAVHHVHQFRYNFFDVGDPAGVGLSFAAEHMFFASFELQSNVWLAERRQARED
jgi:Tol biopolymer transport system component